MTPEQQKMIHREFQDAKTPEEHSRAIVHAILALVDCQCKTATRVKKLSWRVLASVAGASGAGGAILSNLNNLKEIFQ